MDWQRAKVQECADEVCFPRDLIQYNLTKTVSAEKASQPKEKQTFDIS